MSDRRRKSYAMMDAEKKEEMLKKRRLRYAAASASSSTHGPIHSTFKVGEFSHPFQASTSSANQPSSDEPHVTLGTIRPCKKRRRTEIDSEAFLRRRAANAAPSVLEMENPGIPLQYDRSYVPLPAASSCVYCTAKKFYCEPPSFCCSEGEISLVSARMPKELLHLFTSADFESVEFRRYVRTYNNHLAFSTFGAKTDPELMKNTKGIYTFSVQGKVYHSLPCLHSSTEPSRNLQLYFYDGDAEFDQRMALSTRLNRRILEKLLHILRDHPYVVFLRQLKDIEDLSSHRICLVSTPKLDQRVFNEPTTNDVSAILSLEDESEQNPHCHIQIYEKNALPHKILHNFSCFDTLQYPLFFAKREGGWHIGIEKLQPNMRKRQYRYCQSPGAPTCALPNAQALVHAEESALTQGKRKRNIVSARQYYCYKLQMRESDESGLLHGGRLLQQYIVDMFVKVEPCRLDFLRKQQKEIRTEYLQGIVDSISAGTTSASSVGRRVILPPSFMGGPRDTRKRYLDAMALVQRFVKPDLFITMTCNPAWEEISAHLLPGELPQNRPDLLSRVFKAKLEMLKKDLLTDGVFGVPAASVYSIEFKKRGLPYVHILMILEAESKPVNPEVYDRYITAEIPDPNKDPELYTLVTRHMIHGPCGYLNMRSPCMRNRICKNTYPKNYLEHTTHGEDSYPHYRRRNTGVSAKVRGHRVDNRWVVSYIPYLLRKYDCHMNVEICSTIKLVKYLYKYIYKGPDRVAFRISSARSEDEITEYQKGRWVSPPEAAWRLYSFPLFEIHPPVLALQLHLPNNNAVSFRADQDLESVATNSFLSKTMLTEFFYMNKYNERASTLRCIYKDFPKYFVWDSGKRYWSERKKGRMVGRVVSVSPTEGERYYLRLLLNNVQGPTSFQDLLTVTGYMYQIFCDSALHRGLLATDLDLHKCLDEVVAYQMPNQLRNLFSSILVFCSPSNPRQLLDKYWEPITQDYMRHAEAEGHSASDCRKKALTDIQYLLDGMGKTLSHYGLGPEADHVCKHVDLSRDINHERRLMIDEDDLLNVEKLNTDQLHAFTTIMERITANEPTTFFVDGPGGTGKTFLYRTILATLRAQKHIAIATATSGIAASVLPGGRTAHSRFKLPLHSDESRTANVSKQSSLARLIREAKLMIWDEEPMAHRKSIEAFSDMLKDITGIDRPFGNKVVVFGGDFRQVLPVVTSSTRLQQIDACLISSPLWTLFHRIQLNQNMRVVDDRYFSNYLLRIGNGIKEDDADGYVRLPQNMTIPFTDKETSLNQLIRFIYPDINAFVADPMSIVNRGLLAPTNNCVDDINNNMLQKLHGEITTYTSTNVALDLKHQGDNEDFLSSLNPASLPSHKLELKPNCPIMLLQNLNPTDGLCNGTRLICRELKSHTIIAEIVTGPNVGDMTILHIIPLEASKEDKRSGIPFKRYQLSIRLCFAMTINKAQGQTLDRIGIYLREPVFSHGQLYVALSRARKANGVRVLVTPPTLDKLTDNSKTTNVVYREILEAV